MPCIVWTTISFYVGLVMTTLMNTQNLGINKVEYPENNSYFNASIIPENRWAFNGHTPSGLKKEKTIKVTNYKTGKKTDIWVAFKDNPLRDPSMAAYWEFVAKTQQRKI